MPLKCIIFKINNSKNIKKIKKKHKYKFAPPQTFLGGGQ